MTGEYWNVLLTYVGFMAIATLLALARRWLRPGAGGESVWRKYPTYILLNVIFVAAAWLPPTWHLLAALLALLGGLAAWEITRALLASGGPAPGRAEKIVSALLPVLTAALIAAADWFRPAAWLSIWLAILLLFVVFNTLTGAPTDYARRALALAGCLIYLPVCLAAYIWIRYADPFGLRSVFLYLVISTNDALAQITGQLLGKRPLAPRLSPAKTVEGALGGVLFAAAIGATLGGTLGWSLLQGAATGLALGLAGLAGDLTASAWKRALGLKNFSALLGPHGGVLDRFDGLIFAAPVFYLLLAWVGR